MFRRLDAVAYPRWRGEHLECPTGEVPNGGLPPLARGAHRRVSALLSGPRPTPAGAGSTATLAATCPNAAAYPRWRGEHICYGVHVTMIQGLPPLARGARRWSWSCQGLHGPTPAGAGSTSSRSTPSQSSGAYPRWRGEHLCRCCRGRSCQGLPPLAQGAQVSNHRDGGSEGPTPAGAGSTHIEGRDGIHPLAYPRWRGEHRMLPARTPRLAGLPPLARGAHLLDADEQWAARPTPAGAGSTPACGV